MNARFAFLLLSAAALPAVFAGEPESLEPLSSLADLSPAPALRRGALAADVVAALGDPAVRLSRDVWVYWNHRTDQVALQQQGFDTLVVAFTQGRVTNLRLVTHQSVEALMLRLRLARPDAPPIARNDR